MDEKITFKKDNKGVKNPRHLQRKVFMLYSPRQFKIEPTSCRKIDTEVIAILPTNSKGFLNQSLEGTKLMNFFMENTVYG